VHNEVDFKDMEEQIDQEHGEAQYHLWIRALESVSITMDPLNSFIPS
jgi:hypothetical protein